MKAKSRVQKRNAIAVEISWASKILYSSQTKIESWKLRSPNDKHFWRTMAERVIKIVEEG